MLCLIPWHDSSPNRGLATAVAPGSTIIGAELSPIIGSATLSVSNATLVSIADSGNSESGTGPIVGLYCHWNFQ